MAKRGKGGNGMRLICPNCGAQYEVDESVIPETGRDVQCSACGHTWFQPSRTMIEAAEEAEREAAESPDAWEVEEAAPEADALEAEFAAPEPEFEAEPEATQAAEPVFEPEPDEPAPEEPEAEPAAEPVLEPAVELNAASDFAAELETDFEPDFEVPSAEPEPEAEPEATSPPAEAQIAEAAEAQLPPIPESAEEDGEFSQAIAAMMSETVPPAAPPQTVPETEPTTADGLTPAPAAGAVPRRSLDDNLLAILREEAEREAAARRAEGSTLETQEEMNLEPDSAATAANRAAAKLATTAPGQRPSAREPKLDFSDLNSPDTDAEILLDLTEGDEETAAAEYGPSRRQMLPDIEEINSTLRASADRGSDAAAFDTPQARAQQRSGFRFGFTSVMAVALIGVVLYALAPRIADAVPMLAPALDAYIGLVNTGRLWLDGQLRAVIDQVQNSAGG